MGVFVMSTYASPLGAVEMVVVEGANGLGVVQERKVQDKKRQNVSNSTFKQKAPRKLTRITKVASVFTRLGNYQAAQFIADQIGDQSALLRIKRNESRKSVVKYLESAKLGDETIAELTVRLYNQMYCQGALPEFRVGVVRLTASDERKQLINQLQQEFNFARAWWVNVPSTTDFALYVQGTSSTNGHVIGEGNFKRILAWLNQKCFKRVTACEYVCTVERVSVQAEKRKMKEARKLGIPVEHVATAGKADTSARKATASNFSPENFWAELLPMLGNMDDAIKKLNTLRSPQRWDTLLSYVQENAKEKQFKRLEAIQAERMARKEQAAKPSAGKKLKEFVLGVLTMACTEPERNFLEQQVFSKFRELRLGLAFAEENGAYIVRLTSGEKVNKSALTEIAGFIKEISNNSFIQTMGA
jgi:hypothetical protein